MDPLRLREQYPVLERYAYLNAGTCGPLPAASLRAGADAALHAAEHGRTTEYFERLTAARGALRGRYATAIGARPDDVALTTATGEGMARVLLGLDLRPGDEILTAEEEHPNLLGPLAELRRRRGVALRTAPLARLAEAVEPGRTALVACSHVGWITGDLAPTAALAQVNEQIPVLLDGAQSAGAIEVGVEALGCAFYAGAGQKWLSGPIGTGMLWVHPAWQERLPALAPTYLNLAEPGRGLDAESWPDARRHDTFAMSGQVVAAAEAACAVLEDAGWSSVRERATALAAQLAEQLRALGREVGPRDATTLVGWQVEDPAATVARAVEAGVVIRALPGTSYVRASVGAWNDESDLERVLAVA